MHRAESCQLPDASPWILIQFLTAAQKQRATMIPSVSDCRLSAAERRSELHWNFNQYDESGRFTVCLCESFTFRSPLRSWSRLKSSWCSTTAGQNPVFGGEAKWPLTLNGGWRSAEWQQWTSAEQRLSERIPPVKHRLSCSAPSANQYTPGTPTAKL